MVHRPDASQCLKYVVGESVMMCLSEYNIDRTPDRAGLTLLYMLLKLPIVYGPPLLVSQNNRQFTQVIRTGPTRTIVAVYQLVKALVLYLT